MKYYNLGYFSYGQQKIRQEEREFQNILHKLNPKPKKKNKLKHKIIKNSSLLLIPNKHYKVKYFEVKHILKNINIQEIVKKLTYHDFLKTPYWKSVSSYMKGKFKKCCQCGSTKNLNVHHKNYNNLGKEHETLEDLILVCKPCHEKIHFLR